MNVSDKKPETGMTMLYIYGFAAYLLIIITIGYLNFWEQNQLFSTTYNGDCVVPAKKLN